MRFDRFTGRPRMTIGRTNRILRLTSNASASWITRSVEIQVYGLRNEAKKWRSGRSAPSRASAGIRVSSSRGCV